MSDTENIPHPRVNPAQFSDPSNGRVVWSPAKTLWIGGMYAVAIVGGALTFSLANLALFLVTTAGVLCFGHSLGMHRRLIHASFDCPLWLEHAMVYLGTLVGLAGPISMIHIHDTRDWAQRQGDCHDYFAHRRPFLEDFYWQTCCSVELTHPPVPLLERRIANDRFYKWLERTWMWQQLPWAILFFAVGGIGAVVWGVAARVAVCVTGHWLIGYFAHRQGHRDWHVGGAGVQGYNIPLVSWLTFGECWHNNHHAFPGSAKLALEKGQSDPGWWVLMLFRRFGLVTNIKTPESLPPRPELHHL
ncbi:MAG: acyl-CoA desaturase [Alphaproteobacteria bacterium]|nr:MAG: acyl-CoA desaturase [Alphaproteobacteria bacterium]